jgi:hypothetical protein
MPEREYLLIRGRLNRADDFTPRRCGSTAFIHHWPRAEGSDVFVDTISRDGTVLRSEPALIESERVCAPGEETWRVRAYVALDAEAAEVRLRRGGRVLWEIRIPDPPEVRVALESVPVRGFGAKPSSDRRRGANSDSEDEATSGFPGGKPAVLALDTSEAAEPDLAYVTVVHQWGDGRFRTVHIGPAERTLEIAADQLPGGRECRLIVIYSNGIRSATAATDSFRLEAIGPVLSITRPGDGAQIPEGTPLTLEGLVQDPERPATPREAERLVWTVDGREVGSGPVASVDPLEAGEHTVGLSYRSMDEDALTHRDADSRGSSGTMVRIVVAEATAVPANAWPDRDPFADL